MDRSRSLVICYISWRTLPRTMQVRAPEPGQRSHARGSLPARQGDAQGLLTQYGHVAVFAQILLRRYSVSPAWMSRLDVELTSLDCLQLDRATFSPIDDKAVTTDVFRQASSSYPLSSLNDEDKALVSGWIGALYGHGIADDLLQYVLLIELDLGSQADETSCAGAPLQGRCCDSRRPWSLSPSPPISASSSTLNLSKTVSPSSSSSPF